jgi:hypothetical protein
MKILLGILLLAVLGNTGTAAQEENDKIGKPLSNITRGLKSEDMLDPKFVEFMDQELPVPAAFQDANVLSSDVPIEYKFIFFDMYRELKRKGTPESMMVVPNYLLKLVPEHLKIDYPLSRQVLINQEVADKLAEKLVIFFVCLPNETSQPLHPVC